MTTAYLTQIGKFRGVNNAGAALVGGLVYTYAAGTTTPIATYTDSTAGTPNANPVVLNARGEADIWLKPNVGYKFVLTDQYGAIIWSEDNVFLSQLLTLYGGVDTGSANSYAINFASNFTALTDGIYIIWYPSNTNTGASQINVNGLGNIAIVNVDGTPLVANEIIANTPTYILYKAGQWVLGNVSPISQLVTKVKTALTSRANTTAYTADPDLQYVIPTAGTYQVEFYIDAYLLDAVVQQINYGISFSGSITAFGGSQYIGRGVFNNVFSDVSNRVNAASAGTLLSAGGIGTNSAYATGTLIALSSGTVSLSWGPNVNMAQPVYMAAGSYLKITRLS